MMNAQTEQLIYWKQRHDKLAEQHAKAVEALHKAYGSLDDIIAPAAVANERVWIVETDAIVTVMAHIDTTLTAIDHKEPARCVNS